MVLRLGSCAVCVTIFQMFPVRSGFTQGVNVISPERAGGPETIPGKRQGLKGPRFWVFL